MQHPDYSAIEASSESVVSRWNDFSPSFALMLGSGWGPIANLFTLEDSISYGDIPALGATGVEGHAGKLSRVTIAGKQGLLFEGRRHLYELPAAEAIIFPMFLARKMGASRALLTNAAGGVRADLNPGSIMVLRDHINLTGFNPLQGPGHPIWGERFPDMSAVYSAELREGLIQAAAKSGVTVASGVYCAFAGPSYETPAEVQMAKTIGADAVGMSTIPSAILANAAGMEVIGISCITNHAAGISKNPLSHQEVIDTSKSAIANLEGSMKLFLETVF